MPSIPTWDAPNVSPQGAGSDYINAPADPAAFGAGIGAAEQRLGGTVEQGGAQLAQVAEQRLALHNNLASDDAFNQFQDASTKLMHGDPNDPQSVGYMGLQGNDALNARGQYVQKLEDTRVAIRGGLQNQQQQLAFDEASRRLNMYNLSQIGDHADRQAIVAGQATQQAALTIKSRAIAADPFNDDNFQHNVADMESAAQKQGALMGLDHDAIDALQIKARQQAYTVRADAMAATNAQAALTFMQQNRAQFDPTRFDAMQQNYQNKADTQYSTANAQPISKAGPGYDNNVGNIKASPATWDGKGVPYQNASGATFETFATPEAGVKAAVQNLQSYAQNNGGSITLGDAINKWAPSSDNNDPAGYAAFVSKQTGIPVTAPLPVNDPAAMANVVKAMTKMEKGKVAFSDQVFTDGATAAINNKPLPPPPAGSFSTGNDDLDKAIANAPTEQAAQMLMQKSLRLGAIADRQRQAAQETAINGYVTQMLKDPTKVDPDAIANDPTLSGEQKWHVANMLATSLKPPADDHDSKTYGPGFYSAYQAVHAPDGDPSRITDPNDLYGRVGKDLTVAGVDKLTSEIQAKRSPEGEAETTMKSAFLANAKAKISGSNDTFGIKDPEGESQYLRFLADFFPKYDAARKTGQPAADLLNPDSKSYLGSSIPTFARGMAERMANMGATNGAVPTGTKPALVDSAPPDLTNQAGIVQAYKSGRIPWSDAHDALVKIGAAKAPIAAPAAPAVPPLTAGKVPTN